MGDDGDTLATTVKFATKEVVTPPDLSIRTRTFAADLAVGTIRSRVGDGSWFPDHRRAGRSGLTRGMQRRTKIVATVGPASEDPAVLRQMVAAGMNMARLSLAHGPVEETLERIQRVRKAADEEGEIVGVLADLPGPKIRPTTSSSWWSVTRPTTRKRPPTSSASCGSAEWEHRPDDRRLSTQVKSDILRS